MLLADVKNCLLSVSSKVYHYTSPTSIVCPYIVWNEDSQANSLWGSGEMINQVLQGVIHCFSNSENEPLIKSIQSALNNAGISWRLNSVQYEHDTKIIHTEWVWEIVVDV